MWFFKKKEEETKAAGESKNAWDPWDDFCDWIEEKGGPVGRFLSENVFRRLSVEAPVIVGFVFLCVLLHVLNMTIAPGISFYFGVDDYFKPHRPMHWVRLISHIFAHDGIPHLRGNMTNLLLVGPSAEHVFGSKSIVKIMFNVALSSAIAHIILGKKLTRQLGASGVVFSMILLNALVSAKGGKIPVSFMMTAFLWIGDEVWRFFFSGDQVSHHAHLTGAFVGLVSGYMIHRRNEKEQLKKITSAWLHNSKARTNKKKQ